MSMHVVGFRPPDEEYEAMKAVYYSCKAARISLPNQVLEFFEGEEPSEHGTIVDIPSSPYSNDMREGIDVDITNLPTGVKIIRFYNSY